MELKEYTSQAIRTESRIEEVLFHNKQTLLDVMQLFMLSGTLLDNIKKKIFYNKSIPDEWTANVRQLGHVANLLAASESVNNRVLNSDAEKDSFSVDPRVFHALVGIATEGTELIEALYQSIKDDAELDTVNVLEEIGDISWYTGILIDATNSDWSKILEVNIDKLKARYPEKFTSENAINRNFDVEREILETLSAEFGAEMRADIAAEPQAAALGNESTTEVVDKSK